MTKEIEKKEDMTLSFETFKDFEFSEDTVLDLDVSDLKLPKYKLMQSTSQEVTKSKGAILPGQYYNTVTKQAKDTIPAILLFLGKSMVCWKKPFKRGEEPLCQSYDGKTKTGEGIGDGNCLTCHLSSRNRKAWDEAKKNNETKPPCNMSYVWLAIDTETNTPFRIICSGASVTPTKDFLNLIYKYRFPAFMFAVDLKSEQQENEQGVFYVMKYENVRPNPEMIVDGKPSEEKKKEFEDMALSYKDIFMSSLVASDIIDAEVHDIEHEDKEFNTGF